MSPTEKKQKDNEKVIKVIQLHVINAAEIIIVQKIVTQKYTLMAKY